MRLKKSYRFLRGLVRLCARPMRIQWARPFTGEPSVFVCNHAGALGPLYMCARFPLADELHPWMNAQVLRAREIPAYVRQDFWWKPDSRWAPVLTRTLPYAAAAILPPILRTAPTVPVYHDMRVVGTLRESLRVLRAGEHLVIFPEQPSGYRSHHYALNSGFLRVAQAYARVEGKPLAFWPVRIDTRRHVFQVDEPLYYDVVRTLEEQTGSLLDGLRAGIRPPGPDS